MTLKPGLGSVKVTGDDTIQKTVGYMTSYKNYECILHCFWHIWVWKILRPWNPGQRSPKVMETGTMQ